MDTLLNDIRYALRAIRRNPGVIVVAVISLGLGIGANASLFSAVDVFMFRPLPYDEADRLTHVYSTVPARGWTYNSVSIPDFLDLREQSQTMDIATSYGRDFNLSGGDRPERIRDDDRRRRPQRAPGAPGRHRRRRARLQRRPRKLTLPVPDPG